MRCKRGFIRFGTINHISLDMQKILLYYKILQTIVFFNLILSLSLALSMFWNEEFICIIQF